MVHFMAKRSNFDYLLAILMNITPKPVMLKNSFFVISVTMPKKKVKFYIDISWLTKSNNILKLHKKHAHAGLIS